MTLDEFFFFLYRWNSHLIYHRRNRVRVPLTKRTRCPKPGPLLPFWMILPGISWSLLFWIQHSGQLTSVNSLKNGFFSSNAIRKYTIGGGRTWDGACDGDVKVEHGLAPLSWRTAVETVTYRWRIWCAGMTVEFSQHRDVPVRRM